MASFEPAEIATNRTTLLAFDEATLQSALRALRTLLSMETALVTQFKGPGRYVRGMDTQIERFAISQGDYLPLTEGYCGHVIYGRMPQLIPDTASSPETAVVALRHPVPIGCHIGIPVKLHDGRLFGSLCCFSAQAHPSMSGRDLRMMHAFADLIVAVVTADLGHDLPPCH